MDRFADRRFDELRLALDSMPYPAAFSHRNDLLSLPIFNAVSPTIYRWATDHRGRMLAWKQVSGRPTMRFSSDSFGGGWRAKLDRVDLRQIMSAAAQACPEPMTLNLRWADGERRWSLLRLNRANDADGRVFFYGTVEDIHDRHACEARALAESQDHYRWSVDLNPQVPWTAGPDGSIEEVGPRWCDLTGLTPAETLGGGWLTGLHDDDRPRVIGVWTEHLASGEPVDIDYRIRLNNGDYRWMRSHAAARRDEQGAIVRWYGMLEDIHVRKLAQHALSDSDERFRLAVHSAQLGIWDFDISTGLCSWSTEFRAMLGLPQDQPATNEAVLSLIHPEDRERLAMMQGGGEAYAVPPHFETTLRMHRADNGALRWIRSTGWTTLSDQGHALRIIVTFMDVTEERNVEERIRWAASHDPMTRLPNRALWQARLEEMAGAARDKGERFGLMLLDIDDLKRVNDSLGHDAGDALLCAFAARLEASAPPDAVLGRLGGDEFGLIARSMVDIDALESWAERLTESLRKPHVHRGRSLDCGVSMGAVLSGEHGDEAEDLLKAADLALYASKAAGRGRLTLFHSPLRAEAQQRSSMIRMARQVIADDLVMPYYQPKIDLRTGRVLGYEALLRWTHPRLGVQLPGSIAAAFEHGELAVALTRRMLDAVLRDVGCWLEAGFDPGRVAINASAADFMQDGFAEDVLEHLVRFAVPPAHIEIEVTETVFMGRGTNAVARALAQFAQAGISIALDDFGTGYASLTHLKHYPVNVLKIDRSFVSNIAEDAGDAAIVDAVVKLGGSFGMEVVAEGVETEEQAQLLLGLGCVVGQGFLLGRPQPYSAILPPRAGM
ncbi:MAG: EAL domain-containing protein [Sphingomonadaceae bacterium]|nr:EAL domain-containing protein [Sphingomonadaceae bacterium]